MPVWFNNKGQSLLQAYLQSMKHWMRLHRFGFIFGAALFMAVGVLLCVTPFSHVHAQVTKTVRVELKDDGQRVFIGKSAFVIADQSRVLNEQILWDRYEKNLQGNTQTSNTMHSGLRSKPTWMLFSVRNMSDTEDWVLHFGNIMDGRHSLARVLKVSNITNGDVFIDYDRNDETGGDNALKRRATGAGMFITIPKDTIQFFAVYLETDGVFVNSVAPSLMSERAFLNTLRFGEIASNFMYLFFLGAIGFFIALSIIERSTRYALFGLYFLLTGGLFFALNQSFVSVGFVSSITFAGLLAGILICGLFATRTFLELRETDFSENTIILSCSGLLVFGFMAYVFLQNPEAIIDDILLFITVFTAITAMAGLGFAQEGRGKYGASLLGLSWVVYFFGLAACGFSAADLLPSHFILINAFWFAVIGQFVCMVFAVLNRNEQETAYRRQLESREKRTERSIARLQQSKESADQARLLRVIERERELMAELREREMQRTAEMRQAKMMADEANAAKSAFLAVVSHEIRTPMTGIMGMVKLLTDTQMNKQQNEYVQAIQNSGDTMMALLNDILDFEKIESGNMELESIDCELDRLVQGIITLMSGHAAEKNISLGSQISDGFPSHLIGDPTRLRQVLLNLVNNAIKFTERGAVRIILSAKPTQSEGDEEGRRKYEVTFSVEDTGIGISEEAQAKLFSPFSQAENSTSRKYGGTGLGLAICKRLVEAMGGSIAVESEEGRGSRFYFTLIMREGKDSIETSGKDIQTARTEEIPQNYHVPSMNILIVEDNAMNRKVLTAFLKKDNHTVTPSESAEQAIEILSEAGDFDLIFCDVNMPGMSGIEFTKALRAMNNSDTAAIPVIALTGNVRDEDIQSYFKANMNGFVAKPINSDVLKKALWKVHNDKLDTPVFLVGAQEAVKNVKITDQKPHKPISMQRPDAREYAPIQKFLVDKDQKPGMDAAEAESQTKEKTVSVDGVVQLDKDKTKNIVDVEMMENLKSSLGDKAYGELLEGFWEKAEELAQTLGALKDSEDFEAVFERAHELKGMAANFGFTGLAAASKNIEKAAHDKNAGACRVAIDSLEGVHAASRKATS